MTRRFAYLATLAVGLGLVAGCHESRPAGSIDEPAATSGLKAEGVSTDFVEVGRPRVEIDDGVLNVSGHVRRKLLAASSKIEGRVDVDIIGPDGAMLTWLPAVLAPNPLPTEGSGEAGYELHYGWLPPAGSTVRVHFVDQKTAALEDAGDTEYTSGSAHGGHAGGGGGHTGGHSGGHGHGHGM